MIFAVVPAAGKSSRMGRPKLALPIGGRTVLERVIQNLKAGGIDRVLVVLGPHVAGLQLLAEAAEADVLLLAAETPDMRATVEHGLGWLEQTYHPRPDDAWMLVPADHPTLGVGVVRSLILARDHTPGVSIVIPTHQGRRGHPTLIGWSHVPAIQQLPPGRGLNEYLRQQKAVTLELPVDDPDILVDLDTPEDYARLAGKGGTAP